MRSPWVWFLLCPLLACGQTRQNTDAAGGAPAQAGTASGGAASGSTSAAGTASGGHAGMPSGGVGGTGVLGGSAAVGGESGAPNLFECSTPYEGPQGGPRTDGPEPAMFPCANMPDEVILQRYDDFEARVPRGSYYEPPTANVVWGEQCSKADEDTVSHAGRVAGAFVGSSTTPWFYEAEFCETNSRRLFRELRCDYFDGMTFKSRLDDERVFFTSLLWWRGYGSSSDAVLLRYDMNYGNATDTIDACWLQTVHGDFGLCDEVSLMSSSYAFEFAGNVRLNEPQVLRTIKGKCH